MEGEHRGRQLGYPTANISPDAHKAVPARGVYAVRVGPVDGRMWTGMMNVGVRPTFDGVDRTLEVHLIDFHGDLYRSRLRVEFVEKVREERRFDSVEALREQLSRDRDRCSAVIEAVS